MPGERHPCPTKRTWGPRLHVLIVSQYFWPEDFRINDLASGLLERGHEITVLTGLPNYPAGKFLPGYGYLGPRWDDYHGVRVIRVPLLPRGNSQGWRLALNYLSFALSASLLGPFLCSGTFDLIFVFEPSPITVGLPAIVLKKLKNIPVMLWVQDLWPESLSATGAVQSQTALRAVRRLVKFIYRHCGLVLVTSTGFVSSVRHAGVELDKIRYFPQWAESVYRPMTLDDDAIEHTQVPDGFRVLFAGNIGTAQSFPTILEAAERLEDYPDIQWVILGDGRMRTWAEAQIKERGLTSSVHLLGRHPAEAMPRFFSLADVLLVTLRRDPVFSLTLPGKVQSYLACAKPIIAGLEGEGARVVEEAGAGLTCPPEDSEALARTVLAMYRTSPTERQEMGYRGRKYYERHFEREMLLDRLDDWIAEVATGC